jgi:thiosulfate dehydrogenase [quinone] large subunit
MNEIDREKQRKQFINQFPGVPSFLKVFFGNTRWAWLWGIIRIYLGYSWFTSGLGKLTNPAWVGSNAGTALTGFINNAVSLTTGAHPSVQSWYAYFLQHAVGVYPVGWSYFVAIGETLVGISLFLGLFTWLGAFFGGFANWNYLLAGSVSTNPYLLVLAILVLLAWKVAGWYGLDHWVVSEIGTPWHAGLLFQRKPKVKEQLEEKRKPSSSQEQVHQPGGDD